MDGEKIVIEQQDEADVSNNSGVSREEGDEKPEGEITEEDTKPVIGTAKVETNQVDDKAGGDVEVQSECPKCHLPTQVKEEGDADNNVNGECCKCHVRDDEGSGDKADGDITKDEEKNDEKSSDSNDKKKSEDLDFEDLMEVEDS